MVEAAHQMPLADRVATLEHALAIQGDLLAKIARQHREATELLLGLATKIRTERLSIVNSAGVEVATLCASRSGCGEISIRDGEGHLAAVISVHAAGDAFLGLCDEDHASGVHIRASATGPAAGFDWPTGADRDL